MEKERKKISLATYVVSLIIMGAIIVFLAVILVGDNTSKEMKENTVGEKNKSQRVESLDIDSEIAKELYNKILKYNIVGGAIYNGDDFADSEEYENVSFYKDSRTTYNTLSNTEKIIAVLSNIKNEDIKISNFSNIRNELSYADKWLKDGEEDRKVEIYTSEVINSTAKEIFGEDYSKDIDWKSLDCCGTVINYINGQYYKYDVEGGGLGNTLFAISELKSAEKEDEYIYLYDNYLYIDEYEYWVNNAQRAGYYTSSDKTIEIENIDYENKEFETMDEENEYVFEKYKDKLNTYKHTFKKDENGNYYWVSTEIVNND